MPGETHAVYGDGLVTNVLVVDVAQLAADTPDRNWLTQRARAVVTAAVRMSLGIIYSGGERALDVALCALSPDRVDTERGPSPEDRSWLAIMDASSGGSGAVTALERDGLESLLRLSRMVVERLLSHDRLLARCGDFWPEDFPIDPPDGSLTPGALAKEVRTIALRWFNERLRPEYSTDDRFRSLLAPVGYELGSGLDGDWGRAWFAREGGLARLKWARLGWRHPNGQATFRADFGVDREWLGQGRPVTVVAPAPVGYAGEETDSPSTPAKNRSESDTAERPKGCLPGFFGIFGKSTPSKDQSPADAVENEESDASESSPARSRAPKAYDDLTTTEDVWLFEPIAAQAHGFTSMVDGAGDDPPDHDHINSMFPDLDLALRRTDTLLEPLAQLMLAEVTRRWSAPQQQPVWTAAVHAAMLARSLNRPRTGAPVRGDLVEALLSNEASTMPRACLLAALTRQWGLPSGIFVSRSGQRVMGAMPVHVPAQDQETILGTMVKWRREHWSIESDGAERLLREPMVLAVPPDTTDCIQVAVDFVPDVWLSALTANDLDDWYYIPLRPILDVNRPPSPGAPPSDPPDIDPVPPSLPTAESDFDDSVPPWLPTFESEFDDSALQPPPTPDSEPPHNVDADIQPVENDRPLTNTKPLGAVLGSIFGRRPANPTSTPTSHLPEEEEPE